MGRPAGVPIQVSHHTFLPIYFNHPTPEDFDLGSPLLHSVHLSCAIDVVYETCTHANSPGRALFALQCSGALIPPDVWIGLEETHVLFHTKNQNPPMKRQKKGARACPQYLSNSSDKKKIQWETGVWEARKFLCFSL